MARKRPHPMRSTSYLLVASLVVLFSLACEPVDPPVVDDPTDDEETPPTETEPPYWGTIFLDPDVVTEDDPTTFEAITATGQGSRVMFDRRVNNWITVEAFLFEATYSDGFTVEIQVNPEFETTEAAQVEAAFYAPYIGQLSTALRRDLETVWIHKGVQLYGGGNNNILIHTGQTAEYLRDGILEETLIHEATHTSLDGRYASSADWQAAQTADGNFISTYARDNPDREDMAESFLPYLMVTYRRDRISEEMATTIENTMGHRITYFQGLELDMHPVE